MILEQALSRVLCDLSTTDLLRMSSTLDDYLLYDIRKCLFNRNYGAQSKDSMEACERTLLSVSEAVHTVLKGRTKL